MGLWPAGSSVSATFAYLLVVAIGARWTLFLAGAIPAVAGLAGIVLYSRMRTRDAQAMRLSQAG